MPEGELRSYEVGLKGWVNRDGGWDGKVIVEASSPGQAKSAAQRRLADSWDPDYTALTCRVLEGYVKPPSQAELAQRECDAFNKRNPVGTLVHYWSWVKEGDPTGTGRVIHEATVYGGSYGVVYIDGTCSHALTHVERAE